MVYLCSDTADKALLAFSFPPVLTFPDSDEAEVTLSSIADLNPLYELELHKGTQIEESWNRLLSLNPTIVY